MRVSAKVDYAVRAGAELAAASGAGPVKSDTIAKAQGIPLEFLENILLDLKHAASSRASGAPKAATASRRSRRTSPWPT